MKTEGFWTYATGRRLLGRIGSGSDLIAAIERLCDQHAVAMASLHVNGSLSSATFGVYDQNQQVYVTERRSGPMDILACSGTVSHQDGRPCVHVQAALADGDGRTFGGRLFSPTTAYAAELVLLELVGAPLKRVYDEQTGMMLWQRPDAELSGPADCGTPVDNFGVFQTHPSKGGK